MKLALLFPGQGAQYVGMGKEIYDAFPAARAVYDQADDILKFSLSDLCFAGPEPDLNLTINSQPAIYVTSLAIWAAIKQSYPDLRPTGACGLSLGEFSALTAAGSLGFEDGLRLVRKRGQWMHEAGQANPGSMCSVIGLAESRCAEVAEECGIQVANYNSPEQIVLSGKAEGVAAALNLAKEKGAKRVVQLNVSGAFHSRLMAPAADKLRTELAQTRLAKPELEFLPNVRGTFESEVEKIRSYLSEQVTESVRWTQTIQSLASQGTRVGLEMGPGKVLKGLIKRIADDFLVLSAETPEDLMKIGTVLASQPS
ncbi:MAG: ACP S-malonyltransferase [Candidatus Omnitrophica bacterium]|nr:ACP S-malonyltransferase [Candidatus Omnitrophota bacterium]